MASSWVSSAQFVQVGLEDVGEAHLGAGDGPVFAEEPEVLGDHGVELDDFAEFSA